MRECSCCGFEINNCLCSAVEDLIEGEPISEMEEITLYPNGRYAYRRDFE